MVSGTPLVTSSPRHSFLWGVAGMLALLAAFPPLGLWPLALLAPWPLAVCALGAGSPRGAFGRLSLLGLAVGGVGTAWLAEAHPFNLAVVAVVEAPLVGLFGWMAHRGLRKGSLFPWLPLIWVAHEMVRMSFPESGYGWVLLGQALAASPLMVQVADLGGVLAVSFVAASFAAAVFSLASGRPGWKGASAVVAAGLLYGLVRPQTLSEPQPGPLLATIQPGFEQHLKDDPTSSRVRWDHCMALCAQVASRRPDPDLLVWPETMWPWRMILDGREAGGMAARQQHPGNGPGEADASEPDGGDELDRFLAQEQRDSAPPVEALASLFAEGSTHLLLGAAAQAPTDAAQLTDLRDAPKINTAAYHDPSGRFLGRYDKHILVPGGETIPLRSLMPEWFLVWLDRKVREMAGYLPDLTPGPGPRLLDLDGLSFGVTICFENAYGDYNRRLVARGARFLVNLSNEGWFGTSAEFDQMQLHSVLRAVETRRAIFRSTNTGISCLVRPDGSRPTGLDVLTVGGRDRAVAGSFTARVPLHQDGTLYVLIGDALGWLCLAAGAARALLVRVP
jgi:apolipoprotein N-acyltransferase